MYPTRPYYRDPEKGIPLRWGGGKSYTTKRKAQLWKSTEGASRAQGQPNKTSVPTIKGIVLKILVVVP